MVKIVIISDGHLLQRHLGTYDPVADLKEVLKKVSELSPDFILVAGDMFDKKKTQTSDVRHPEGEEMMMQIREIFVDLQVPIHVLRGNHEDERILLGLDKTVDNFHYVGDRWIKLGDLEVYFMNTRYEGEYYDEKLLETEINQLFKDVTKRRKNRLLISHEWISDRGAIYPKSLLTKLLNQFDRIFNGHMHFYAEGHLGFKNLVCLPSLLPSRLRFGQYWVESYSWLADSENYVHKTRTSPFGFVELTGDRNPIFHAFNPSVTIIKLELDTTGLDLKEARKRFKEILLDMSHRSDREKLVIFPSIAGTSSFSAGLLEDIRKDYEEKLNVQEIVSEATRVTPFAPAVEVKRPILTVDQLVEGLFRNAPEMAETLTKEKLKMTPADVREILKVLIKSPHLLQKGAGTQVHQHVSNFLEAFSNELERKEIIKALPVDFSTFLVEKCREALR